MRPRRLGDRFVPTGFPAPGAHAPTRKSSPGVGSRFEHGFMASSRAKPETSRGSTRLAGANIQGRRLAAPALRGSGGDVPRGHPSTHGPCGHRGARGGELGARGGGQAPGLRSDRGRQPAPSAVGGFTVTAQRRTARNPRHARAGGREPVSTPATHRSQAKRERGRPGASCGHSLHAPKPCRRGGGCDGLAAVSVHGLGGIPVGRGRRLGRGVDIGGHPQDGPQPVGVQWQDVRCRGLGLWCDGCRGFCGLGDGTGTPWVAKAGTTTRRRMGCPRRGSGAAVLAAAPGVTQPARGPRRHEKGSTREVSGTPRDRRGEQQACNSPSLRPTPLPSIHLAARWPRRVPWVVDARDGPEDWAVWDGLGIP